MASERPPRVAVVHAERCAAGLTDRRGKVDRGRADADRGDLLGRTDDARGVEIDRKGLLGKAPAVGTGPGFGANGHALGVQRGNPRAPQVPAIDLQFRQRPVLHDVRLHERQGVVLGLVGGPDDGPDDEIGVHDFDHVPFVAGEQARARLAPMAHLRVAQRRHALGGDAAADAALPGGRVRFQVLRQDAAQRAERGLHGRRLRHRHVRRHPRLHAVDLGQQPGERVGLRPGSLQSISKAAFRLVAPSSVTPAPCSTWARGILRVAAAHVTTAPKARPSRFQVSSTRPAPTNGDESSAARKACQPKRPVCFASATVRSNSFWSRLCAIIRSRNFTNAPWEKGASDAPRQPSTNCQRWSTRAVMTASASPT